MKRIILLLLTCISIAVYAQRQFPDFPYDYSPDSSDIVIGYDGSINFKTSLRNLICDDCVTQDKLGADVVGSGMSQDVDGSLSVDYDANTFEIYLNKLYITDQGLDSSEYGLGSIYPRHIFMDSLNMEQSKIFTSIDLADSLELSFDETGNIYIKTNTALRFSTIAGDSLVTFDYANDIVYIHDTLKAEDISINEDLIVGDNIYLGDGDQIIIGDDEDGKWYYSGGHNIIAIEAGDLQIQAPDNDPTLIVKDDTVKIGMQTHEAALSLNDTVFHAKDLIYTPGDGIAIDGNNVISLGDTIENDIIIHGDNAHVLSIGGVGTKLNAFSVHTINDLYFTMKDTCQIYMDYAEGPRIQLRADRIELETLYEGDNVVVSINDSIIRPNKILNEFGLDTAHTLTADKIVYATDGNTIDTDDNLTRSATGLTIAGDINITGGDTIKMGNFMIYELNTAGGFIDYTYPIMSEFGLKFDSDIFLSKTSSNFILDPFETDSIFFATGGGIWLDGTDIADWNNGGISISGTPALGEIALWHAADELYSLSEFGFNGDTLTLGPNDKIAWGDVYIYGNSGDTVIYIRTTKANGYNLEFRPGKITTNASGDFIINRYPKCTDYDYVRFATNSYPGRGLGVVSGVPFIGIDGVRIMNFYADSATIGVGEGDAVIHNNHSLAYPTYGFLGDKGLGIERRGAGILGIISTAEVALFSPDSINFYENIKTDHAIFAMDDATGSGAGVITGIYSGSGNYAGIQAGNLSDAGFGMIARSTNGGTPLKAWVQGYSKGHNIAEFVHVNDTIVEIDSLGMQINGDLTVSGDISGVATNDTIVRTFTLKEGQLSTGIETKLFDCWPELYDGYNLINVRAVIGDTTDVDYKTVLKIYNRTSAQVETSMLTDSITMSGSCKDTVYTAIDTGADDMEKSEQFYFEFYATGGSSLLPEGLYISMEFLKP